jgi:hypothetical protein
LIERQWGKRAYYRKLVDEYGSLKEAQTALLYIHWTDIGDHGSLSREFVGVVLLAHSSE